MLWERSDCSHCNPGQVFVLSNKVFYSPCWADSFPHCLPMHTLLQCLTIRCQSFWFFLACKNLSFTGELTIGHGATAALSQGPDREEISLFLDWLAMLLVGFLWCKSTLLTQLQLVVKPDPYVLVWRCASCTVSPQVVLLEGVISPRCRILDFLLLNSVSCMSISSLCQSSCEKQPWGTAHWLPHSIWCCLQTLRLVWC